MRYRRHYLKQLIFFSEFVEKKIFDRLLRVPGIIPFKYQR
jgi:Holliday junction resolvasome RuvABC DNA-binding subunit